MERVAAPRELKLGNVSDFRRLQPATFAGTEKSLDAEQWLVDMTNLLNAAHVPKDDQVKMIKIQLTDVARTSGLLRKNGWRNRSLGRSSLRAFMSSFS